MATTATSTPAREYVAWLGLADATDQEARPGEDVDGDAGAGANADPLRVGGKGAALARLVRLGFPCPPAFCLTTAAFQAHLAALPDQLALRDALAALPSTQAAATVAELVEVSPMPDALGEALSNALARLGSMIPAPLRGSGLAVRSSGVEEDGVTASFAGLHETELGVTDQAVPDAVRRCWASLWSPPAVAYRVRRGLPTDRVAMAVVVQALVPADAAAVVFTRHPVTGRDDQLLLTACRGLGEPMVAGTVTPDTLVVDRASRSVVEFTVGDRAPALARDGRLVDAGTSPSEPVLSSASLAELIDLSLEVERAFGRAVDIEAACADERWYLVQARPITTR